MSDIRWREVQQVVKKARASSAPGPSGISYQVYKKCPKLLLRLYKMLRIVWKKEVIPTEWTMAEGIFAPKEENSESVEQFRTISLLSVEGKIFFSVLAKRITSYLIANNYVDTSVQKGGVPGFSGCLEHTSILSELIHQARQNKKDLSVIWLDLANAYGSIPHQLINYALQKFKVPMKVQNIISNYMGRLKLRFNVGDQVTKWQNLEKGIITGCTVSVVLFVAAVSMVIKQAEKKCRGPLMESGVRQQPIKAYMDDMTVATEKPQGTRWILTELDRLIKIARMDFKARKCRSLVIQKGKVVNNIHFKIQAEVMPTIKEEPIKYLGKWYNNSLKDTNKGKMVLDQLVEYVAKIEKCLLPGRFKAWVFHHGVIPKMRWPLMLYEIPLTQVEAMGRICNKSLRKWFGVPPCFSEIGLYGRSNMINLPLKSLVDEYKVVKVQAQVTLEQSADSTVREAEMKLRSGRKWSAKQSAQEAEGRLKHQEIVGTTALGRTGLDVTGVKRWSKANKKERRSMIQGEVRAKEDEIRKSKAVSMVKQGAWTRWEFVTPRSITWSDILKTEPYRLQFMLKGVYDLLATPTNLKLWGKQESEACVLCGKKGSLNHILASCSVSLTQGRYGWRHDKVLAEIAAILDQECRKKRTMAKRGIKFINFVGSGKTTCSGDKTVGIFCSANDWRMEADLHKRLKFPEIIACTNKRPDVVIWSVSAKTVILIELTVPWEERMEVANELKSTKYAELVKDCEQNGWKVWCLPVEVGCRGFIGKSMWKMCKTLGINGYTRKSLIKNVITAAERSSSWLWLNRESKEWKIS